MELVQSDERISIKKYKQAGNRQIINQIMLYAKENNYEWFLTLDQDSVCYRDLILAYSKFINCSVGQLTCNIIDRSIGDLSTANNDMECHEVKGCITSGALNDTHAFKQVEGFTESFFIDGVDLDISCKLKKKAIEFFMYM